MPEVPEPVVPEPEVPELVLPEPVLPEPVPAVPVSAVGVAWLAAADVWLAAGVLLVCGLSRVLTTDPRALVTGVSGQDGSYLTALLAERGYEVVGLVRGAAETLPDGVSALTGDLIAVRWDPAVAQVGRSLLDHDRVLLPQPAARRRGVVQRWEDASSAFEL